MYSLSQDSLLTLANLVMVKCEEASRESLSN
jgi:hypothetical protein